MTTTIFKGRLFTAAVILLSVMLLLTAVASLSGYIPSKAADIQETKRTINVSGSGKISVSPDIAYVSLGVVTEDKNAKQAQQDNAKAMDKIVSAHKAAGTAAADIKTVDYNLSPKYDYNKDTGASKIIGYSATNTVQVTVRDITKVGNIIDLAAGSGANISNSVSFGIADYEKSYNEALKNAVTAAKKRAETLAGALGITLTTPVTVTESGSPGPIYNYRSYDTLGKSEVAAVPTPVQAGTIEVNANVSMVYEY